MNKPSPKYISSIHQAPLIHKFTILFCLMSVIPMVVLYYFYIQMQDDGQIQLTTDQFNLTLILVIFGVIVGYVSMREVFKQLMRMTENNRRIVEGILHLERIDHLKEEQNEITILAQSFTAITERLEEDARSLELARKTLQAVMSKVGEGISKMQNIDTFLALILETVTEGMGGKVGMLLVAQENPLTLTLKAVNGTQVDLREQGPIETKEGETLSAILASRCPISFTEAPSDLKNVQGLPLVPGGPLICAPLVINKKSLGMMIISGRKFPEMFTQDDISFLSNVASQTAVSIENARFNQDVEKTYLETISALALAADAKYTYSRGHLDRVADGSVAIAKKLGLDAEDVKTLRDGARLHDIGKIGIPDEIIQKKGPLTEQETALMRKHAEIGESIIKPIRSLSHLCDIIRHHHERLDGSGYPDGIKGDAISPLVRIITISDIYDALTSDRSYHDKMTPAKACDELRRMGNKLDQDIVEVFVEVLKEKGQWSTVSYPAIG